MTYFADPSAEAPPSLRRLSSFAAATLTTHGPYWKLSPTFARLHSWLTAASVEPSDRALALFFDNPAVTPPERCRYAVCYPVGDTDATRLVAVSPAKHAPATEDAYAITTFAEVDAVVLEYEGPAAGSPVAYARLEQWMKALDLRADGPPRERYLAEPGTLARGMMHVEVQQPVRRRV